MYGEAASSIGNNEAGLGPMTARARFFNPYPIQRHATD